MLKSILMPMKSFAAGKKIGPLLYGVIEFNLSKQSRAKVIEVDIQMLNDSMKKSEISSSPFKGLYHQ